MSQMKIVLCPVDFSDLTRQELALASEVCEAFGAHLVMHHNLSAVGPGFTRAWEWHEVHRADDTSSPKAEERLRKILAELPRTFTAEASVSHGPIATIVLQLAEKLPADLLILGSHGWSTEDHASVTERLIERSPCPVLTIHEGADVTRFRLRAAEGGAAVPVLVATDLSESAQPAVEYAFELARKAPLRLHLLHVVPVSADTNAVKAAERSLHQLVPPDLAARTTCQVAHGDSIAEILSTSKRIEPAFLLMGEHARGFFRRFFTRNTAQELLHRAACPVWFVPLHR